MAKQVFFSFHYQDVIDFRANVVRQHKLTKDDSAGYFDASIWEEAKKTGSSALKRLINDALRSTSVTCVLIGSETYNRRWVKYEIFRSIYKCNNLLGIHINNISDKYGRTKLKGYNPFDYLAVEISEDGSQYAFLEGENQKWKYWEEIESTRWFSNDYFDKRLSGTCKQLSAFFPVYDWINDNGYKNFSKWID